MKTCFTVALSILAGIAIGAVAVQHLHAQAKPRVLGAKAEFAQMAIHGIVEGDGPEVCGDTAAQILVANHRGEIDKTKRSELGGADSE